MLFDSVCIWGWPLHSHTHSYIHNGFFRAAQALGLSVVWLDNKPGEGSLLPPNTLFITESQVDSHIPLRNDCFYVLHNCNGDKYKGMKAMWIQCLISEIQGPLFQGKPWLVLQGQCLLMPWATDLLPDEIQTHMDSLETLWANRQSHVGFVGYFLEDPWGMAERFLRGKQISITKLGGYGLRNVSVHENVQCIQSARLAPALQSQEQINRGYLPCRILKNISYGALGVTNNPSVERLFGPKLFSHLVVGTTIEDTLEKGLAAEMDFGSQRALMTHIQTHHTYVNRLQEIDAVLVELGYERS